jgi:putative hydrolase of the HAD superfamily
MPECLIFNLVGTLVEYEAGRTPQDFARCHHNAAELGCTMGYTEFIKVWDSAFRKMKQETVPDLGEFHLREVCDLVVDECGINPSPLEKESLISRYTDGWLAGVSPVPGASGLLKRLSKHYRLALISNTHYPPVVYTILDQMALTDLFEQVTLSVEVGRAKPHPLIFEHTLQRLGLTPDQAFYVGASYDHDYKGARKVGMDCHLIGNHARVTRDHQLRSILDLAINFETARK